MEHEQQRPSEEWLNGLTERIIGCAFKVSNALGCGFLEKVCENALVHELRKSGLRADPQQPVKPFFRRPVCLLLNFGKPRVDVKRYRGSR